MAIDFATFKLKYPELVADGDTNQDLIEDCIADAELILGTPPCPKLADNLILSHAANCVALSGGNPNGQIEANGPVSSTSVGSVSVSYGSAESKSSLSDWYKSTPYGRKFLMYQKYCYGTGAMVAP